MNDDDELLTISEVATILCVPVPVTSLRWWLRVALCAVSTK